MSTVEEVTRRGTIARYRVLVEPLEPDLRGLVQLAARLSGVSTAAINIIDERFQHSIATVGFPPTVCDRADSMCATVLDNPGPTVIADLRGDPRFESNPFVNGEIAAVRFYASSPLVMPGGVSIGTLCVFDEKPGDLSADDGRALALLARQVVDVLELRRITRELAQSNEQLESFASQISHDLRNPLTALTGFIELAADSPELARAPQAARALARAESAATRMGTMIADLLEYARIGGSHPRQDEVDLEDVVRFALEDLRSALDESGATVVVDASVRLLGDATLLRVLIENLVANAVKFTRAAGRAPQIEVHAHAFPGGWRVTVDDNGPGVPLDERERVFELKERATALPIPGLGIGLSTCRRIVQAHGGTIGIDTSPAGGASVWVVLPFPAN